MRLSPWLAPLKSPGTRLANGVVRRRVSRRRSVNRLSSITERLEARTLLTSFFVDSYLDTVDVNPGMDGATDAFGKTSLRAAIMEANAQGGSHQIFLEGGHFSLTLEGSDEDAAAMGDLDITANLQIFGGSSFSTLTTVIDAQHIDRVFDVHSGGSLVLEEIEITGGDLRGQGDGGAIRVDSGNLQATNVLIIENRASNGGAIFNNGGVVTVTDSVLVNNYAEGGSGSSQGGAIDSSGGTLTVQQSTIHDNHAQDAGGGIAVSGGTLNVTNSTIAQNSAGDFQETSGDGGGIYIQTGGTANLLTSTIAFNDAGNEGGGIWVNGSLTIEQTLLSNNMTNSGNGPEGFLNIAPASVTSNGFNLVRENTSFTFTSPGGDQIGTSLSPIDPNLLGLADNGGFTPTIALGAGSLAIDAGPFVEFGNDQRGFSRVRNGDRMGGSDSDIGAFEVQAPSDFFVDNVDDPAIVTTVNGDFAGDFQVTDDANMNGTLDAGDIVTFDPNGQPVFGLEFGVRAFSSISNALTAVGSSADDLNEVVLGAGTFSESVTLDRANTLLRGHTGLMTRPEIDADGANFGIQVTADGVQLDSLSVTGALTTGVDVQSSMLSPLSTFQASNILVNSNSGDGLRVVDSNSVSSLEVQIRDSGFSGNTGDGLIVTDTDTVELKNVTGNANSGDGISIANVFETALDTVTASGNGDHGFNLQGVGPMLLRDPRTSTNTSGNLFRNVSVLNLEPVVGDVGNSVTVTGSEIQFEDGVGATQQALTLSTNVNAIQITGGGGDDLLGVDYSAGNPPAGRQLTLDGGPGTDVISSTNDAHHKLTDQVLSIAATDDISIFSFERGLITGGAGDNHFDAADFDGQVTLVGLAGNDKLHGSASDDILDGGVGNDVLVGGPLEDQYVLGDTTFEALNLAPGPGVVTILDETDTEVATVDLGSDFFRFNDVTYSGNSLFVSPSGVASFNGPVFPQDNFDLTNSSTFVDSFPIIAPLFDDWVTGIPGLTLPDANVLYKFEDTGGDAGNDRLIIEWNDVYHRDQIDTMSTPVIKDDASPVTFQLILELNTFDRDGDITFNYVDLDTGTGFANLANGASATVGGKDGGDNPQGVRQVSFNEPNTLVGDSRAIIGRDGLSDGDDVLNGGDGDDVLVTSFGRDSLDGGSGAEVGGDRLVYDGLRNPFASDHLVNEFAIESRIFEMPGRSYDFKAEYTNFEELDLSFGPADQNVTVDPQGLPSSVSIDTQGPSASDTVTIVGTAPSAPSGVTLFDGNYSGTYSGTFSISGGPLQSIPSVPPEAFPGIVMSSINNGVVTVSDPDPGTGVVDSGGNISFSSVSGDGYTVGFSGTLGELEGTMLGNGTWNILEPNGLDVSGSGTWMVERVSGAPMASDGADDFVLSGTTLSVGTTTFDLAGVEDLILDLSGGGADSVSVDQTFSGSARNIRVVGDAADDSVSLQSTANPQLAGIFDGVTIGEEVLFNAHLNENRGGGALLLEEVIIDGTNQAEPDNVVISPDGSRVYVAAFGSDSLVVYDRDRVTGDLTLVESLVDGANDFNGFRIGGLNGATNVAVSADGRYVYVTSENPDTPGNDGSLAFFTHHPGDNRLTFISSTTLSADLPTDVTLSPNGEFLLVTTIPDGGSITGRVMIFGLEHNGDPQFAGSLDDGGLDGSGEVTINGLAGAEEIAISPDGQFFYVTALDDNSVTVFSRPGDDGEHFDFVLPLFIQKVTEGDSSGGGTISGLDGASSLTISPDGRHLYVTGEDSNAIAVFDRDSGTGMLTFVESLTNGVGGGSTLETPTSVSISPDGQLVYVAAETSNAISVFDRNGVDGKLTFRESLQSGVGDTDAEGTVISGLTNVFSLAASTDGLNVYAVGTGANSIVRFNTPRQLNVLTDGEAALSLTTAGGDDMIAVGLEGLPASVSIDAGGSGDSDQVNVFGTATDDTVNVNGSVLTSGPTTLSVTNSEGLNLVTEAGDDTVNVTASASGPQLFIDGGLHASGDVLNVDAVESQSFVDELQVLFSGGLQPVGYSGIETVAITNAAPTIDDNTFVIAENSPVTTAVGTANASDPEIGESLTWRIVSGNTGNAFAINSTNGEITVNATLDFEDVSSYALLIEVEDTQMLTDTATITISIADVEPLVATGQTFGVNENSSVSTAVDTVMLDPDGDQNSVEFSIVPGPGSDFFAINSTTGAITVAMVGLDHETTASFSLNVQVTDDGGTTTDQASVVINVLDINEPPTILPQTFSVDENSPATTSVGTVLANDADTPGALNFAITAGDPTGIFAVNSSTGAISVARAELDHEAVSSRSLTLQVTDPGGLNASATITIGINDVNESPILDPIGNQTALVDLELAFTASASDPDSPAAGLLFSLGAGAPVGASITSGGDFTFTPTSGQDEMTFPVTVTVTEDNPDRLTASETFLISVTSLGFDFGDAPDSFGTTLSNNGPRHGEGSLFLGDAVDTEDDGQPDEMALGDDNSSILEIPADDEDGITFLSALSVGTTRLFRVSASEAGFLDAWIDFDQSGDFSTDENLSSAALLIPEDGPPIGGFTIGSGIAVPAGFSTVSFDIPNTAMLGATFSRFRLSSTGGLTPTGLAVDGEVEDHLVEIVAPPVGDSDSLEAALDTAIDQFFDAFPDELNDPDPTATGNELPLAVQAEGGAEAQRTDGDVQFDATDPLLRAVVDAVNDVVNRLEEDRAEGENILVLALHPVDFLLTDPQGRTFGSVGGVTDNQIGADATYSGDGVVELLTIRNADSGQYGLQLVGVGGVFRGGSSLITPAGTQQVTFQGSLAQSAEVELALTYQEGALTLPSRTDLEKVDFSQIADAVAGIPTAESNARTLAAGATEALASIALDRLDAAIFSSKDEVELSLEELLERLAQERKRLLEAIETSLDDDDLEKLKLVLGDPPEDVDSAELLTRVLLETISGPLIPVPQQVDDISRSLRQLLKQLQEKQKNQQPPANNNPKNDGADADGKKDEAKSEPEDKRTSQRVPVRNPSDVVNSVFIVNSSQVAARRKAAQATTERSSKAPSAENRQTLRGPKFITAKQSPDGEDANVSAEAASEASPSED